MGIDNKKREKTIVRTSLLGIVANFILVGFKATIGFVAGSMALISDALNNLTDALSSIVTIIGTKLANKKPDREHPFGHGRIEYIASTIVAALILIAGVTAIYNSVLSIIDHFTKGTMPEFSYISVIIISIAVAVKLFLSIFYRIKGKQVDSGTLKASGLDAFFDALLSLGTLIAVIFAITFNFYIEGYVGVIIGGFIIFSGIKVLKESFSLIIGERHDAEEIKQIMKDINSVPGVHGAYDLILNSYGPHRSIGSVHIGVDNNVSASEIQTIERNITYMIYEKYNIIMTVGIYVENDENEESKKIRAYLLNIIKENKTILQLHGFFLDENIKSCIFDLVISFDNKNPEETVKQINLKLCNQFPEYKFIINIDKDFSLS